VDGPTGRGAVEIHLSINNDRFGLINPFHFFQRPVPYTFFQHSCQRSLVHRSTVIGT
jgi:hypothetical protein